MTIRSADCKTVFKATPLYFENFSVTYARTVRREDVLHARNRTGREGIRNRADRLADIEIADLLFEEQRDRRLIRAVDRRGQRTAAPDRALAGAEAREGFFVRRKERQALPVGKIELPDRRTEPPRICQRILDRDAHIRHAELRDHRMVAVFDQRVDDALAVHDHVDVVRLHIEKPLCLDEFEALVHQRGAVDRHLRAHIPVRVLERVGRLHTAEFSARFAEKRTARRR